MGKGFLGATKHLYKRVCLSVRPSVHRSVGQLVGRLVGQSVGWSVGPLRLLIFGGFGVIWSTAWPVLALVVYELNSSILCSFDPLWAARLCVYVCPCVHACVSAPFRIYHSGRK